MILGYERKSLTMGYSLKSVQVKLPLERTVFRLTKVSVASNKTTSRKEKGENGLPPNGEWCALLTV